jgi:hypothetical protein
VQRPVPLNRRGHFEPRESQVCNQGGERRRESRDRPESVIHVAVQSWTVATDLCSDRVCAHVNLLDRSRSVMPDFTNLVTFVGILGFARPRRSWRWLARYSARAAPSQPHRCLISLAELFERGDVAAHDASRELMSRPPVRLSRCTHRHQRYRGLVDDNIDGRCGPSDDGVTSNRLAPQRTLHIEDRQGCNDG